MIYSIWYTLIFSFCYFCPFFHPFLFQFSLTMFSTPISSLKFTCHLFSFFKLKSSLELVFNCKAKTLFNSILIWLSLSFTMLTSWQNAIVSNQFLDNVVRYYNKNWEWFGWQIGYEFIEIQEKWVEQGNILMIHKHNPEFFIRRIDPSNASWSCRDSW